MDNVKDIDVLMNIYNFIEYSEKYSQTSERLWLSTESNQLEIIMTVLLIFLLIMIPVFQLNMKNM